MQVECSCGLGYMENGGLGGRRGDGIQICLGIIYKFDIL